jgi:protein TonB
MLGCASDRDLSGCDGGGDPAPADSCEGTIPRSQSKPIDLRNPGVRVRRPAYPAAARRTGLEGDTRLVMHVDRSGWICSLRVGVSSGIDILDRAALQGARRWRLDPATSNGKPVESLQVAVVSFALTGYEFEE